MPAKKSKKHRKRGRNKKDSDRQTQRTERNKVARLNYERKKAGLPPVSPTTARYYMDKSIIKE